MAATTTLITADLDTDAALTANSDSKISTQKAVKSYVDGKADEGSWTPVPTNLNVTGSPTYAGSYKRIKTPTGYIVFWRLQINGNGGTTASSVDSTYFTGLSAVAGVPAFTMTCTASNGSTANLGVGLIVTNGRIFTPQWSAYGSTVFIDGFYFV